MSGNILVIGQGELGTPVLESLSGTKRDHNTRISVMLRPSNTVERRQRVQRLLDHQNVDSVVDGDISADSVESLAEKFALFDTVIVCVGFAAGGDTQINVTKAVLQAKVSRYIPWQFGVDYDTIGKGSSQDLFDAQLEVRNLLRSQNTTRWVIVSTGMFTNFVFLPAFGVVDVEKRTFQALGSWDTRVTVTTADDIGKLTAEIVYRDLFDNKPIFVGGDCVSYRQLADIVEEVVGEPFERTLLTVDRAKQLLAEDPDNVGYKYSIVFGEGIGVSWEMSSTWNYRQNIAVMSAKEFAQRNLKPR